MCCNHHKKGTKVERKNRGDEEFGKYHKETPCYFFFSFTKSENRRAEQVLPSQKESGTNDRGEEIRKGGRRWEEVEKGLSRVNMVQILCTHGTYVCTWKNNTC
jgi:hypothetical protein